MVYAFWSSKHIYKHAMSLASKRRPLSYRPSAFTITLTPNVDDDCVQDINCNRSNKLSDCSLDISQRTQTFNLRKWSRI